MAVEHLDTLSAELPELFQDKSLPAELEEGFVVIGVESIESTELGDLDELLVYPEAEISEDLADSNSLLGNVSLGVPNINAQFPGAPVQAAIAVGRARDRGTPVAPPEALAFYLPYHYYYPQRWGVYITFEGVLYLGGVFQRYGCNAYTATKAARYFLYYHEYFHHRVESFGTRLELVAGIPAYKAGIERRFRQVAGTDEWLEEALANAYAYRQVQDEFKPLRHHWGKLDRALREYIDFSPPGYRKAAKFLSQDKLAQGEDTLSEDYLHHVLGNPMRTASIWRMFPHAFSGITNRLSRVNYLISKGSPLFTRLPLRGRLLSGRKLRKKLKAVGCRKDREGGKHEIWQGPNGNTFALPRHPGDIPLPTARAILAQAGLKFSFQELLAI